MKLCVVRIMVTVVLGLVVISCSGNDSSSEGGADTLLPGETVTPVTGEMVDVKGGAYNRIDPSGDQTVLTVTVSDFSIGKYEITQKEWSDIMGSNPASEYGVGDHYPVYYISWFDTLRYCNKRSMAEGLTPCYSINDTTNPDDWGLMPVYSTDSTFADWNAVACNWSADGYRLPTEAEWEYAARGGEDWADDYDYSGSNLLNDVAWYDENSNESSHLIGTKLSNQLGIKDMSGNLYEFCWDWKAPYADGVIDPTGPGSGDMRIVRGGSWMSMDANCITTGRYSEYPNSVFNYNGFRVVRRP